MKKRILILIILLNTLTYSQYGWMIRGTGVDPGALVKGISFADANNGMIVTSNFSGYKVYRTSNGGVSWTGQTLPTSNGMWAVKYFDPSTAVVCGASGSMYRTINGGTNWTQINVGGSYFLTALSFIDNNTGWVSGGPLKIMKTTNNGVNWVNQSEFSTYTYSSIHMVNANTGFAADYFQRIVKTTNGGSNWLDVPGPAGFYELWGTYMTDGNTVYCCGEIGKIIKSTDQGISWTVYNTFIQRDLYAIHFVNSNTGYCVGDSSLILRTSNSGLNWSVLSSPQGDVSSSSALTCISFINANTGYLAGNDGTVLYTTSGGLTPFEPISSEIPEKFELKQNYPNPFNPETNIEFTLPESDYLKLSVFDITGKEIEMLVDQQLRSGTYKVLWNASSYPSGVYFYSIYTKSFSVTRKMILTK